MASRGWTCRRIHCGRLNPPHSKKCPGCGARRPKKRVPEHAKALRDVSYEAYVDVNERIHGVDEVCAVCGASVSSSNPDRRFDRDHDHTTGFPWSGKPRGLVCVSDNILMPPKLTPAKAREIAAYLTRVEEYYAGDEAA